MEVPGDRLSEVYAPTDRAARRRADTGPKEVVA